MSAEQYRFRATVFEYEGPGSWHFAALPAEVADEFEERCGGGPGFGSVPVEVRIGSSVWQTSLFPDRGRATYLLPVKKPIRTAEGIGDGSTVEVELTLLVDG